VVIGPAVTRPSSVSGSVVARSVTPVARLVNGTQLGRRGPSTLTREPREAPRLGHSVWTPTSGIERSASADHSRRWFLKKVVAATGVLGGAVAETQWSVRPNAAPSPPPRFVPFHGRHQAGIATAPPTHVIVASFDVDTTSVVTLSQLLRSWSSASEALVAGRPAPGGTGENLRLPPSALTLTFGFGPDLFDGRFGLTARRPPGLAALPAFPTDRLDSSISGGDLMVQVCAEDAEVSVEALRLLRQLATGTASVRWQQAGFRASGGPGPVADPRNLFGFKDGTANPRPATADFDDAVWVKDDTRPLWLRGGSFLCVRRIRMDVAAFDKLSGPDQQVVIGRFKGSGAPLSGGTDASPLRLRQRAADGQPAIPVDSHVRLASPTDNSGATMLRRGYSYDNGTNAGGRDRGLLFLAYVRDVEAQFVAIQQRLATHDRLNAFITPVGSAVFAIPPGVRPGRWIGQGLLSNRLAQNDVGNQEH
jgi:deferrochelatase/peroxidase EfeB